MMKSCFYKIIGAVTLSLSVLCSCSSDKHVDENSPKEEATEKTIDSSDSENKSVKIPSGPRYNDRIRLNRLGNLRELFNDSNKYQLAHAQKIGITPISSLKSAYFTTRPIVHIETNDYYYVDSLSHSVPFLVPEAANLLADIGKNFIDSLASRGADGYKIRVTSILRTPDTVRKLRRVNRNATDSSTHQYATTFDISYAKFYCMDSTRTIHDGDLKNLLAEVLYDLKKQGRCYVKFEKKSPCFHITAIK